MNTHPSILVGFAERPQTASPAQHYVAHQFDRVKIDPVIQRPVLSGQFVYATVGAVAQLSGVTVVVQTRRPVKESAEDSELLNAILDVAREASEPGWDGPGTEPVTSGTVSLAMRIIPLLPKSLPLAEASATPSGTLSLDWDKGPSAQLAIMITESRSSTFAAYIAGERMRGELLADGPCVSEDFLSAVRRWEAV